MDGRLNGLIVVLHYFQTNMACKTEQTVEAKGLEIEGPVHYQDE